MRLRRIVAVIVMLACMNFLWHKVDKWHIKLFRETEEVSTEYISL